LILRTSTSKFAFEGATEARVPHTAWHSLSTVARSSQYLSASGRRGHAEWRGGKRLLTNSHDRLVLEYVAFTSGRPNRLRSYTGISCRNRLVQRLVSASHWSALHPLHRQRPTRRTHPTIWYHPLPESWNVFQTNSNSPASARSTSPLIRPLSAVLRTMVSGRLSHAFVSSRPGRTHRG
jgi:hypothetical protein